MKYIVAGQFPAEDIDEAKKIAEGIFELTGAIVGIEKAPTTAWVKPTGYVTVELVQNHLPSNYSARLDGDVIVIEGFDNAGWTMADYVVPRLASGMIFVNTEKEGTT